jgi:hypothetical protein
VVVANMLLGATMAVASCSRSRTLTLGGRRVRGLGHSACHMTYPPTQTIRMQAACRGRPSQTSRVSGDNTLLGIHTHHFVHDGF